MRIVGNPPSGGKKPTTPTIGTATDGGTGTTVSVAFTPSTYIGKSTITYTATSSPGSLTGTGSGSPITVSGLTTGTAYTFTVKGDTNYGVASDYSAASNSVTPASPSSFESIATVTGNGSATTLTLSSIPSTYKSLHIRVNGLPVSDAGSVRLRMRLNNDTGANYTRHILYGDGTSAIAVGATNLDYVISAVQTSMNLTSPLGMIIDLIDYASTSKYKTVRYLGGIDRNGSGSVELGSGLWLNTAAVNRLDFYIQSGTAWATGTSIALYGVK